MLISKAAHLQMQKPDASAQFHTEAAEFQPMLLLAFSNPLHILILGSASPSL